MNLEIVSPEAVIFNAEVDSVAVPGVEGEFHMLNKHAAIVSLLKEGVVKVYTHTQNQKAFEKFTGSFQKHPDDDKILVFPIKSGTVELKDNKVIVLAD
ncbi:F0F1 ATP synthase subunit epsilon [Aureibaculum marinum]|uniref:F0F1 ATP synthase subunit epsilon n=1 Tax=Aureibaculum marinum TaxID=2487930 RepID=A0A3N4P196_9FLAO|nr:F0F1 ATP synthase subunit epsilon [Aureibaculum marinum]RPE00199.1 F0F1 ATP synthase subunit epsilon [Aureibaculum marinum]